jgi:preprotein translocase subunit SecA
VSSASAQRSWPGPGVLWGDYPEQSLHGEPIRRRAALGWRALNRFADAVAVMPAPAGDDVRERLELLACARAGDDAWMLQAFGAAARAMTLTLGYPPHRQQLLAARVLLDERLAEMATGEGKTAAIALAAAVAALAGTPVHVITANDYLAQRDAGQLRPFFARLGLRVGCVTQPMPAGARREAYGADVTYCTAKEVAFDYLRDALARDADLSPLEQRARRLARGADEAPVLRGLCMAIIDEADTVLIDEARMPLVLAQDAGDAAEADFYRGALGLARQLTPGLDYRPAAGTRFELTGAGRQRMAQWPAVPHPLLGHRTHREAAVELALTALLALHRDQDYLVKDAAVHLIDETTGRAAYGRAWSLGLHQLVELKEGVALSRRNSTVTQITFQRFFTRYLRLGGASGTLREAATELRAVYGLRLVRIPARTPARVERGPARVFVDSDSLWQAVVQNAQAVAATGRPVLIGTETVAQSEALAGVLTAAGLPHRVLNARQDRGESELIAVAGRAGSVTVATSMAGRGTDIAIEPAVAQRGGLHVILCQLNGSPRIDRQFLGRAGRQGQPGSTQVMVALDFALLRRWCPVWWRKLLHSLRFPSVVCSATIRFVQGAESFTQKKQRVTISRATEAEDRNLTFSRHLNHEH